MLSSDESLASPDDPEALAEKRAKRPAADAADIIEESDTTRTPVPSCSPEEIEKALAGFRKGVSGGLDSLTPDHLKDLLSAKDELSWPM